MGHQRGKFFRIIAVIFAASFLWACEGDDGAQGPAGPQGPQGDQGPPGSDGTSGAVPFASATRYNIEVLGVTFDDGDDGNGDDAAAGRGLTVDFKLTNDLTQGLKGVPADDIRIMLSQLTAPAPGSGASSEWQSYNTNAAGNQATYERATAGDFTDNTDGTYRYIFSQALPDYANGPAYDAASTHRLGFEIRNQVPVRNNGIYDFVPNGGAMFTRNIIDNDTCNACHDRFAFHGGPRTDVTYCVTCHNPYTIDPDTDTLVDMKYLIHNIHVGRDGFVIIGHGGTVHDFSDIVFPQDVRNCQTCHEETDLDTPDASNWRLVPNRGACGTCHYDNDGIGDGDTDYVIEEGEHPGGAVFTDDTACAGCHGEGSTVTNPDGQLVRVDQIHRIPSLEASDDFVFEIVGARNVTSGGFPEVDFRVLDATGAEYDIDTAPEFTACADGTSRLFVIIGWTTDNYDNTGNGVENAEPIGINALGAGCGGAATDADGDLTFTVVSPTAIPAGLGGSETIAVGLEGHPGADLNGDGVIAGRSERIAVTNAVAYFGIDGADADDDTDRAVNIKRCDQCHKQLSMHGNNRTDNPEVCVICHNPNATDEPVRGIAGSSCLADLGDDDEAIDFKRMVHRIHAGNVGFCGFNGSTNDYRGLVYPGDLNNCEGCHEPGSYYPVEPGVLHGTTVDTNDMTIVTDDVVISPNASVCSSCHTSDLARVHMEQNGADFNATKAADSTLISSEVETCVLCHGAGRAADVVEVHGVDSFDFN